MGLAARAPRLPHLAASVSEKLFSSPVRRTVSLAVAPGVIEPICLRKVVPILDRMAVHFSDHVASENACLERGRLLRLGDECALGSL